MRLAVLGAGLQGTCAAFDMLTRGEAESVLLVDRDEKLLGDATARLPGERLTTRCADLSDAALLPDLLSDVDGLLSALPYFMNLPVAEACANAGVHYVDLGGNTDLVREMLKLDAPARASGASLVPDCGLAPGLAVTVAMAAIEGMEEVEHLRLRVGGLPARPVGPLGYRIFFSIHGLLNEYLGEMAVIDDGELKMRPTLDDIEEISFPEPVGACEAFGTLGGVSTLPWTLLGRVRNLDYKTVRYPGHVAKLRLLRDLGYFGEKDIGCGCSPREMSTRVLSASLDQGPLEDLVVMRVEAVGVLAGRRTVRRFDMIDRFDKQTGFSAMQRSTAFPASVVLQMLVRGEVARRGALSLEEAIDARPCMDLLARRGLRIIESEESP